MKLFGYYAWHSFINQLKKLCKTWVLVFFLVCGLIGGIIGVGVAVLSDLGDDEYYEEDYDTSIGDEAYSTESFVKILPSEIVSLSKGETIVVWVGRQSCSYCGMYAPVISDVGKDNNVIIYYVDLEDLINFDSQYPYISDERNYYILEGLDGIKGWETFAKDNMGGTPLTLIIKDNKVIGGLSGYTEETGVLDEFKRTGLIEN